MFTYRSYRWRYVCKRPRMKIVVFARERAVAERIISIENTCNIYRFKPAKLFFRKPIVLKAPPYEIECEQERWAEARLKNRMKYFEEHPEEKSSIVIDGGAGNA